MKNTRIYDIYLNSTHLGYAFRNDDTDEYFLAVDSRCILDEPHLTKTFTSLELMVDAALAVDANIEFADVCN